MLCISGKSLRVYLVVFLSMFISGYTHVMLFSFLPFMVQFLLPNIKVENNAMYAGIIAGAVYLGRFLSSTVWGAISDRKGRKPTLLCMGFLAALTTAVFGFSSSFAMAVVVRFTVGLSNGVNGVSKAALADTSDSVNQAIGMSVIACGHGLGFVIGPAVAGAIADPIKQYNITISNTVVRNFLTRYPYSLACLANSAGWLLYVAVTFCLLEESLGTNERDRIKSANDEPIELSPMTNANDLLLEVDSAQLDKDESQNSQSVTKEISASSRSTSDTSFVHAPGELSLIPKHEQQTEMQSEPSFEAEVDLKTTSEVNELKQPKRTFSVPSNENSESDSGYVIIKPENHRVMLKRKLPFKKVLGDIKSLICDPVPLLALVAYATYSFGVLGYDETYSVWAFTPPYLGGLGFSLHQIGLSLFIVGVLLLPTVLFLYPLMERHFSSIKTFYLINTCMIFLIVLLPSIHYIVPLQRTKLLWFLLCLVAYLIQLFINTGVCPLMLFIINSTTADKQGLMNGLAVSLISITKAVAPLVSGVVFSLSLSPSARSAGFPLDYHLIFILFGAVFLSVIAMVACFPETINRPISSNND